MEVVVVGAFGQDDESVELGLGSRKGAEVVHTRIEGNNGAAGYLEGFNLVGVGCTAGGHYMEDHVVVNRHNSLTGGVVVLHCVNNHPVGFFYHNGGEAHGERGLGKKSGIFPVIAVDFAAEAFTGRIHNIGIGTEGGKILGGKGLHFYIFHSAHPFIHLTVLHSHSLADSVAHFKLCCTISSKRRLQKRR